MGQPFLQVIGNLRRLATRIYFRLSSHIVFKWHVLKRYSNSYYSCLTQPSFFRAFAVSSGRVHKTWILNHSEKKTWIGWIKSCLCVFFFYVLYSNPIGPNIEGDSSKPHSLNSKTKMVPENHFEKEHHVNQTSICWVPGKFSGEQNRLPGLTHPPWRNAPRLKTYLRIMQHWSWVEISAVWIFIILYIYIYKYVYHIYMISQNSTRFVDFHTFLLTSSIAHLNI